MMTDRPLIHVVEDDDSMRAALLGLLAAAGYEARGYGSSGAFVLKPPPPELPGCILLDLHLPGGPSGLDLQAALPDFGVELPVIFLTGQPDVASGVRAMKSGAVDFLEKPILRSALVEAVERALAQDAARRAARNEVAALRSRFAKLSPREREVFNGVVAGLLNKQIADELGIAERTVKAQRAQLMHKLGVGSAAELGVLAERLRRVDST